MKKSLCAAGILIAMSVFVTKAYAQTVSIDSAVKAAADEIAANTKQGSKIAILAMRAGADRMSNYLIEEVTAAVVNTRTVTVVDRAQLDLLQGEMDFQMSGEVSDSSAQAIGQKLGAQAIVTGVFEPLGNYYRFRVRVIEVETAAIQVTYSANVARDDVVSALLDGSTAPALAGANDFTTSQRWGTFGLNVLVPGLGSYVIMRDWLGGSIILGAGLTGGIMFIAGASANLQSYGDGEEGVGGMVVGALLATGAGIFSIIRSASYHKPKPKTASFTDPEAWNIALLPGKNGSIEKVSLAYTMHF